VREKNKLKSGKNIGNLLKRATVLLLCILILGPFIAFAADPIYESANFQVEAPVINSLGEWSQSTSFGLHGNMPWIEAYPSQATTYKLLADTLVGILNEDDQGEDDDDQGQNGGGHYPTLEEILDKLAHNLNSLRHIVKQFFPEIYEQLFETKELTVDDFLEYFRQRQLTFGGLWDLLPPEPIRELVFAPLPEDLRQLAAEVPQVRKLFEQVNITRYHDLTKFRNTALNLPGLTEILNIASVKLAAGDLIPAKDLAQVDLGGAQFEYIEGSAKLKLNTGELVDLDGIGAIRLENGQFLDIQELAQASLEAPIDFEAGLARIQLDNGDIYSINDLDEIALRSGRVIPIDSLVKGDFGVRIDQSTGIARIELTTGGFIQFRDIIGARVEAQGSILAAKPLHNISLSGAQLVSGRDLRIEELTPNLKEKFPTGVLFPQIARGAIDIEPRLRITAQGESEQIIRTITGQTITLSLRPEHPVEEVVGFLTYRGKQIDGLTKSSNPEQSIASSNPDTREGFNWFRNFINTAHAQEVQGIQIPKVEAQTISPLPAGANDFNLEDVLVVQEFGYHDFDKDGIYSAEIAAPVVDGEYEIITVVEYEDLELGKRTLRLVTLIDPEGYVYERVDGREVRVTGAIITLEWLNPNTKNYERWPAENFAQENPQLTDQTGQYSFLVPEGWYRLVINAPGYITHEGKSFEVREGRGVHENIQLRSNLWYLEIVDVQTILLVLVGLFLLYNFYRDKMRDRKERNAILKKLEHLEEEDRVEKEVERELRAQDRSQRNDPPPPPPTPPPTPVPTPQPKPIPQPEEGTEFISDV